MTGILWEICQLFCCPPRPSHIVAKLAFIPPPPTYSVISDANESNCRIEFKPEAGWHLPDDTASGLSVFYTTTKRRSRIVCMYIPATMPNQLYNAPNATQRRALSPVSLSAKSPNRMSASCPTLLDEAIPPNDRIATTITDADAKPPYTVLFSHGNAVDIGQMAGFLQSLAYRFGVNILCYDYSGYGVSTGQRLEENLYADAEAALQELQTRYNLPLERIVLYGQSIGTAPTVDLAAKYQVAGVILHSPLMSGIRVVCPGTTRRFCFDPFTNIDKVSRILSPTLIIHGTEDEIVGVHHGRELFARLSHPLEPAWIEGAGHNDIEMFSEYAARLDRFFNEDLIHAHSAVGDEIMYTPALQPHSSLTSNYSEPRSALVGRSKQSDASCSNENAIFQGNASMSTVNSEDSSKLDTCSESVASLRLNPVVQNGEDVEHHHRTSSVRLLSADHKVSKSALAKRRVWTMRKESAPAVVQCSRSETIHGVPTGAYRRQNCSAPTGPVASTNEALSQSTPKIR